MYKHINICIDINTHIYLYICMYTIHGHWPPPPCQAWHGTMSEGSPSLFRFAVACRIFDHVFMYVDISYTYMYKHICLSISWTFIYICLYYIIKCIFIHMYTYIYIHNPTHVRCAMGPCRRDRQASSGSRWPAASLTTSARSARNSTPRTLNPEPQTLNPKP